MYSKINPTKYPASGTVNVRKPRTLSGARGRMRVDQRVVTVIAGEVQVLVCLRGSCGHVTEVGRQ